MNTDTNYFWQNLESFYNQIAFIDTTSKKLHSYSELDSNTQNIAAKIRMPNKGLLFLFITNNKSIKKMGEIIEIN